MTLWKYLVLVLNSQQISLFTNLRKAAEQNLPFHIGYLMNNSRDWDSKIRHRYRSPKPLLNHKKQILYKTEMISFRTFTINYCA